MKPSFEHQGWRRSRQRLRGARARECFLGAGTAVLPGVWACRRKPGPRPQQQGGCRRPSTVTLHPTIAPSANCARRPVWRPGRFQTGRERRRAEETSCVRRNPAVCPLPAQCLPLPCPSPCLPHRRLMDTQGNILEFLFFFFFFKTLWYQHLINLVD